MIKQTHTQRKASPSSQIIQRVPLSGEQTDSPPFGCGVHRIHARNSFHVRVKAKGNQGSCCCAVYLKRPVIAQLTLKYLPSFKNISLHSYLQTGGSRCSRLSSALSFEKRVHWNVKRTHERNGVVRVFRTAQQSIFAGLREKQ